MTTESTFEPDGQIDYSGYDRRKLEDALSNIDRDRYPLNYQNLTRELAKRPPQISIAAAARSDPMKSGNPALSSSTFDGLPVSDTPMTLAGTINKAAMLLALVLAGAGWT